MSLCHHVRFKLCGNRCRNLSTLRHFIKLIGPGYPQFISMARIRRKTGKHDISPKLYTFSGWLDFSTINSTPLYNFPYTHYHYYMYNKKTPYLFIIILG